MSVRYIGNFPPPYGGVTIKNQLLYDTLSKHMNVRKLNTTIFIPSILYQILNILLALTERQALLVGVSSKNGKSRMITRLLYRWNRKTMRKSLYFMMGGTEAERIVKSSKEIKWYGNYKKIYVETERMCELLIDSGLENVKLFPNCRRRALTPPLLDKKREKGLQCVFFSRIEFQKGVDLILEIAKQTPDINYAFYGPICEKYDIEFNDAVNRNSNISYKGIFKGSNEELYNELKKYDVLLFPTRWKTEGVPGILVEAKMSGLAIIASDRSYNAEIVRDGVEGIILKENSAINLLDAVCKLNEDRDFLKYLKKNSYASSEKFCVENYINEILSALKIPGGIRKS